MRGRMIAVVAAVLLVLALPVGASAHRFSGSHAFSAMLMSPMDFNDVTGAGYVATKNMHPLGFSSHSHLTAAFHKVFGVPPSAVRPPRLSSSCGHVPCADGLPATVT